IEVTVKGFLMTGFRSNSTDTTYDFIIFSRPDEISEKSASGQYQVQSVQLEVYRNDRKIGSGVAEYLQGKSGSGTFPMIAPSITLLGGDVYVIFQGVGGGTLPLTLKIIPAVNFAWAGIILFAIGIILIMAVKSKS
ncbi:MAG: hypothetical protein O8C62_08425, partial [Candidatus Methanoperedens sp.]|nr:hypothetical protein [Candidatus Methanoperedens sp.]